MSNTAAEQLPPQDMEPSQTEKITQVNAGNQWVHEGACPTLKNTISQRDGLKLDHEKLHGRWKAAYESKHRMRGMKCLQLKIKPIEGGQKH